MDTKAKKSLIILGGIVVILIIYSLVKKSDCKDRISYSNIHLNQGIDLDSVFRPADSVELAGIIESWNEFDLESDSFHVKSQFEYTTDRELKIIEHYTNENKHYGAVVFPIQYHPSQKYPILVWANGLDQNNPSVDFNSPTIKKLISELGNFFILIPSYRGQALVLNQQRFCSDGFFGDAFDGAADDVLRLLELTLNEFEGADKSRITTCGISRGGTVALLMGVRNHTIKNVVSIAGPTNFHLKEFYHRYGLQYKYQFLSTTQSMEEIREKMIKSSPIYFLKNSPNNILLIHGKNDKTVSIANAQNVIELLKDRDNFQSIIHENGHKFYGWGQVIHWIEKNS